MDKITIRLASADADAITNMANVLRSDRQPFITRSAALKFALTTVAADPKWFVKKAEGATR